MLNVSIVGIIMWEMCTREIPFVNLSSFAIPVLVIKGKRPDVSLLLLSNQHGVHQALTISFFRFRNM